MKEVMECVVLEVTKDKTVVQTRAHSDCSSCGACGGGSGIVYDAKNTVGAKVGDEVEVELEKMNILKASMIMFALPLAAVVAGIILGLGVTWLIHVSYVIPVSVGVVVCVAGAFYMMKRLDMGVSLDAEIPVITRITKGGFSSVR